MAVTAQAHALCSRPSASPMMTCLARSLASPILGPRPCPAITTCAYAFFHFGSQAAQVVIAGHGLGPSIGDANDRARQVIIGEADGLEHSACACAVTAICDHAAVLFGIRYHGARQR